MPPAEELVAIVDEQNQVIGAAPRRVMRAERLLHRSTYILVFNSNRDLYVQKRTLIKDIYPGFWDPAAGGVVAAGESYEEGARRELAEEMGITGTAIRYEFEMFYEDALSRVFGGVFSCVWDGPLTLQAEEVQYVEVMPPQQVLERASVEQFTPDGLAVLRRYLGVC